MDLGTPHTHTHTQWLVLVRAILIITILLENFLLIKLMMIKKIWWLYFVVVVQFVCFICNNNNNNNYLPVAATIKNGDENGKKITGFFYIFIFYFEKFSLDHINNNCNRCVNCGYNNNFSVKKNNELNVFLRWQR